MLNRYFDGRVVSTQDDEQEALNVELLEEMRPLSPEPGFSPHPNPFLPGQTNEVGSVMKVFPSENLEFLFDANQLLEGSTKVFWPNHGAWSRNPNSTVMNALCNGSVDDVEFASERLKDAAKWPISSAVAKFFFVREEKNDDKLLEAMGISDNTGRRIAKTLRRTPDVTQVFCEFNIPKTQAKKVFCPQWSSLSAEPANLTYILDFLSGKLHYVKQSPRNQQLGKWIRKYVKRQEEAFDALKCPPKGASNEDIVQWFVTLDTDQLEALWATPTHLFDPTRWSLQRIIGLSDDFKAVQEAAPLVMESGFESRWSSLPRDFKCTSDYIKSLLAIFESIDYHKRLYPKFGNSSEFIVGALRRAMFCEASDLSIGYALNTEQLIMVDVVSEIAKSTLTCGSVDVIAFLSIFETKLLQVDVLPSRAFQIGLLVKELFPTSLWYDQTMLSDHVDKDTAPMASLVSILADGLPMPVVCDHVHSSFDAMVSNSYMLEFIVTNSDRLIAAYYTKIDEDGVRRRVLRPNCEEPYVRFSFSVVEDDLSDLSIPSI